MGQHISIGLLVFIYAGLLAAQPHAVFGSRTTYLGLGQARQDQQAALVNSRHMLKGVAANSLVSDKKPVPSAVKIR